MGRMLKSDNSPSRFSKFKKSVVSPEKLSLRDWRRQRNRNSVEMELLTGLPVPTVPPYPIEYFEEDENGLSHVNRAFRFSEECLPPSFFKDDKFSGSSSDFLSNSKEREGTDNDSKGSSSEDSRDSVGGSTADSGVVLHSRNLSRRTSGDSRDFRTSPDGRAEREQISEQFHPPTPQNHYPNVRLPPPPYPTYPLRPIARQGPGYMHPISNGTLKRSNEHLNRIKTQPGYGSVENNVGYHHNIRNRTPAPVHRPPMRVPSIPPNSKEHIYVNRPPVPVLPIDDIAPYPGGSKFDGFPPPLPPPPAYHRSEQAQQPLPHLGSQIRSHLWQSSAPRPCGRSKSVHDEGRKVDTFRSRLGSINTLGIPYQATLPSRLSKKPSLVLTFRNTLPPTEANKVGQVSKPDVILTVPANKLKTVVNQPRSPFKKTPVYSKVIKTRKPKKQSTNPDSANANLLFNQRGGAQNILNHVFETKK